MITKLRIHHFFDTIRDLGIGKKIIPHPLGHSYHEVFRLIRENQNLRFKLVKGCDSVCVGCSKMKDGVCIDTVSHRDDFTLKEEFNDWVDERIMEMCGFEEGDITTPLEILDRSEMYLENIFYIYDGNDQKHTKRRKESVIRGIKIHRKISS